MPPKYHENTGFIVTESINHVNTNVVPDTLEFLRSPRPAREVKITFAILDGFYDAIPTAVKTVSADEFIDFATHGGKPVIIKDKAEAPYFCGELKGAPLTGETLKKALELDPTNFEPIGVQRSAAHCVGSQVIKLDLDGVDNSEMEGIVARLAPLQPRGALYTTHSHGRKDPGKTRARLVMILDRQASNAEFEVISRTLAVAIVGRSLDQSEGKAYQQAGIYAAHPDGAAGAWCIKLGEDDGALISADAVLKLAASMGIEPRQQSAGPREAEWEGGGKIGPLPDYLKVFSVSNDMEVGIEWGAETPENIETVRAMIACIPQRDDRMEWGKVIWAIMSIPWNCAQGLAEEWAKSGGRSDWDDPKKGFPNFARSFDPYREGGIKLESVTWLAREGGWTGRLPWWPAEAKAEANGDAEVEAKTESTRRIPNGVQTAIWATAQECGIDTKDPKWLEAFAEATDFSPVKLMNVIDACLYRQESGKFIALTGAGDYRVFTKGDLKAGLAGSFPSYIDAAKLGLLAESFAGERYQNQKDQAAHVVRCLGRISQAVQTHILVEKQFSAITLKVDMFAGKASTRLHDGVAHITLPHIPFEEGPIQQAIIADFKNHWPRLDEFIDLLAASRFAASRKKAYLWLKADSDWGKGLLQSALEDLGLVVTLSVKEVETLMSGGPVGKMLTDFKRAWILWFNEFKTVKSEIKMLEQRVCFSPKNLAQVMAEVYLKMFTSAEAVEALASHDTGVEDQFANRFSAIECSGSIEDRPLFMASKHAYRTTLAAYVAKRLNALVEFYRLMGREAAANHGDEVIAAFHSKHGIGNRYTRLSVALPDLARQHLEWVGRTYLAARAPDKPNLSYSGRRLSKTEAAVLDAVMTRREDPKSTTGPELVYIRTPTAILDLWLESEFGAAAAGKLKWKSADFKNVLPEPSTVRFGAAGGQTVRFVGEIRGGGALAKADGDEVEFVPAS